MIKLDFRTLKTMIKINYNKKTIIFSVVFLFFILFAGAFSYLYVNWNNNYRNRIYPGITIGEISLGGLTLSEADQLITEKSNKIYDQGVNLSYSGQNISLPSVMAYNTDLSFPIFTYDVDKTVQKISELSPKNSFSSYLNSTIFGLFKEKNVTMSYFIDQDRAKSYISDNLKDFLVEPLNASYSTRKENSDEITFTVIPERIGKEIDYDLAFSEINSNLELLDNQKMIHLKAITAYPDVNANDLEKLKDAARTFIARDDLILTANLSEKFSFTITKEIIASWIKSEKISDQLLLGLDEEKMFKYLEKNASPKIDQVAKLSRYEIKDGKMISWQNGADGQKLNINDSITKIKEQYLINNTSSVELVVDKIEADLSSQEEDKINIKELIGTGHSNFAGSSSKRRQNIEVGAKAVHGMLIPPGEEFSLMKTLGEIDAKAGYVQELVIKDNKTIPEYGGGLCQIGTTMFRSALASGVPITARQNHSYRVSYYEPAGTDAAVYDPWPDVRFLNDTGNYILIQSRIVANDIYFDFWGKKDGRIASTTTPVVYNITKPAPAKLIETTSLLPGVKKCTEKAHNGADTYFDYAVNYPDGNVKNVRFKSHYVPWQEVCLIGKPLDAPTISSSTPPTTTTATSTN